MSKKEVENKQKRSVNSRLKSRACTYATVKEDFEQFVARVSEACENVDGKFLSVSYPNEDLAVILYMWSNGLH